jgi:hypothetical protein
LPHEFAIRRYCITRLLFGMKSERTIGQRPPRICTAVDERAGGSTPPLTTTSDLRLAIPLPHLQSGYGRF